MKYEEEFKEGTNASLFQMSLLFEQKILARRSEICLLHKIQNEKC